MDETKFPQSERKMIRDLPLLSILGFPLLILIVKCWKIKCRPSTSNLPPGPPKLPLIGNLHQLMGPLPHHTLANLAKKHGPIMHLQLGQLGAVVVTSSEIAKQVLQTKEIHFAQRPQVFATNIISPDNSSFVNAPYGDYWRQIRKVCVLDLLSENRVKSFRSIREAEVWDLVETISGQADGNVVVNVSPMIFSFTSNVTSRAAFGMKSSQLHQEEEFMLLLHQLMDACGGYNILAELYPSIGFIFRYITGLKPTLEKINKKLTKIYDDIIEKHEDVKEKEFGPRTILDALVQLQNQKRSSKSNHEGLQLNNNHFKSITMEIFSAGSETAATTIEWAMSELVKNPRVMEKARAEVRETFKGKTRIEETDIENLSYLKLVVKETLRLHPPAVLLLREARETCEIGGYEITVGTKIIVNVWALGRDPNKWIEPHIFKPERFLDSCVDFKGTDYEFLPFGAGRRSCPGISFATANIELVLAQLLYHFDWALPRGIKPEEFDMTEVLGLLVRRKHNLELIPTTPRVVPFVPFKK